HRGHRLGLATKVANLRQAMAAEPAWRRMDTWNAAVNEYMLAINTALGFRPLDRWISWQLTPEG
ncbi:MAG TPA: GNAT family N-acetyltransferase, partial [Micromonospora sp.]